MNIDSFADESQAILIFSLFIMHILLGNEFVFQVDLNINSAEKTS